MSLLLITENLCAHVCANDFYAVVYDLTFGWLDCKRIQSV